MLKYFSVTTGLALAILAAAPATPNIQTITLAVEKMTCASCPYIVKKSLLTVPGVSAVTVSYETKTARVTFDDERATIGALTDATTKAGYPSHPKE